MLTLVPIGVAAREMGVHPDTLRRWEKEGRIEPAERTPGGRRRYDLGKLRHLAPHTAPSSRATIVYVRVSTSGQKDDLVRQVARYADACNLFDRPDLAHKLEVLREHCEREGRDFNTIEKTVQTRFDLGLNGERVNETIDHLHALADLGFEIVHGTLVDVGSIRPLEIMAEQVLPALAGA